MIPTKRLVTHQAAIHKTPIASQSLTTVVFTPQTLFVFIGTATAMGNSPVYAVGGPKLFGYATGLYGYNDGALQEGVLAPLQTTGSW